MMVRSIQLPAFHAATTPSGTATTSVSRSVTIINDNVGPMRCAIIVADRKVGEDRGAEVAMQDAPDPASELDQERTVEAEALADPLHVGRACLIARDHRRRIARRDVEQAEHEQRDDRHHGQRREDSPEDVGQHVPSARLMRSSTRPRRTATVPSRCPRRSCATPYSSGRNQSAHRRRPRSRPC